MPLVEGLVKRSEEKTPSAAQVQAYVTTTVFKSSGKFRWALTGSPGHRKGRKLDSDLAESIQALKDSFERRGVPARFGTAETVRLSELKELLSLPRRYREFLAAADPLDVETRTPSERVRLIPADKLVDEQMGFSLNDSGRRITQQGQSGWMPSWVIIGHSSLLGDPYFLDVSAADAEGDCPVYTAMSGTDSWKPRLCASSFAMFVRILAVGMVVAQGFAEDSFDMDDEEVFREALGPKIREHDPAALKAGHWT